MNIATHDGTPQASELLDRKLPHDTRSEMMLLRSIILKQELLDGAAADITAAHFLDETHSKVFLTIALLRENGKPIDVGHLRDALEAANHLDEIGGVGALVDLLTGDAIPSATKSYLTAVRDAYARRQIYFTAIRTVQDVYNSDLPTQTVLEEAQRTIRSLRDTKDDGATIRVDALIQQNPRLDEPIVDGLLRRGETMNIIAPSKVGKSWLSYGLTMSIATGLPWLNRFPCRQGRVLLIDNELRKNLLASRLQTVADAMELRLPDYRDAIETRPLRGRLQNLHAICDTLEAIEPGQFDLIILDAFYRAIPAGVSENDNSSVAALFNRIDATTERLGCAWINIHHSSKGSQAEKSITDVGAGAGSQSRAADTHLVLREHDEPGVYVLDAVVRSFAPVDPLPLRWCFPLWQPADDADPEKLRGRLSKGEARKLDRDKEGKDRLLAALLKEPQSVRQLRAVLDCSKDRCERLLDALELAEAVAWSEVKARGGSQRIYRVKESGT